MEVNFYELQKFINDYITLDARFNLIVDARGVVKGFSSSDIVRVYEDSEKDVIVVETFTQCVNYNIESEYVFEKKDMTSIELVSLNGHYIWRYQYAN